MLHESFKKIFLTKTNNLKNTYAFAEIVEERNTILSTAALYQLVLL